MPLVHQAGDTGASIQAAEMPPELASLGFGVPYFKTRFGPVP